MKIMGDRDRYEKARNELQLRDGRSIDENRFRQEGDASFVQYPIGSGERQFFGAPSEARRFEGSPLLSMHLFRNLDPVSGRTAYTNLNANKSTVVQIFVP